MSRKPSKPETRIEDYLDVMTGGNAALPQPILRIEFYYAFLAGMAVELPQPILDDEKLLAKICGMEVEAPTYIPGISPRLYAYMAKKGGQDVQVPDPILRLECYWYDYSAGSPPSVQEYTGAVPATFVADGTPLLDYIISGNTVQNGTPTPDSPVMPQGTGERTGNLFDYVSYFDSTFTKYNEYFDYADLQLSANTTYTLSTSYTEVGKTIRNTSFIVAKPSDTPTTRSGGISSTSPITITTGSDGKLRLYKRIFERSEHPTKSQFDNGEWLMLNSGSTALPYEPYGYKLDISSGDTTTSVYLGEVESTRRVKKLVLTGDETFGYADSCFTYTFDNKPTSAHPIKEVIFSNAYKGVVPKYRAQLGNHQCCITRNYNQIAIRDNNYAYVTDFKSYLAAQYANGTPVTIWYILAEPETGIANEPLMKIGDYADTLSMEQAGAQIPTANGSTTLDVETTVKPSEVYIKYRGEAVATLSTLSAEVSSPEANEEANPEETEETENER